MQVIHREFNCIEVEGICLYGWLLEDCGYVSFAIPVVCLCPRKTVDVSLSLPDSRLILIKDDGAIDVCGNILQWPAKD